jgi:hypothetical protein
MSEIGPVQMVAVAFDPEAEFEGKIIAELAKLEREATIRILDLLFVHRDADSGDLLALDYQGEDLGRSSGRCSGSSSRGTARCRRSRGARPAMPSASRRSRSSRWRHRSTRAARRASS